MRTVSVRENQVAVVLGRRDAARAASDLRRLIENAEKHGVDGATACVRRLSDALDWTTGTGVYADLGPSSL
jgi:hypothetical protein